jgi:hypothetical protein
MTDMFYFPPVFQAVRPGVALALSVFCRAKPLSGAAIFAKAKSRG